MVGLVAISGTGQANRSADVIFVHGLGGDPLATWQFGGRSDQFWPKWLGEDLPSIGVWSLGYEAAPVKFMGHSMSIQDRAVNALALVEAQRLGKNPTIFICHSLGGLLVKQMVRHSVEYPNAIADGLIRNIKGIVFLATPHSGSATATWSGRFLKLLSGPILSELTANNAQLRELNI